MDFFPKNSFWGWYGRYEGEYLVIGVRRAPEISREDLFANLKIEIDPGHGGWQRGARGITGYAEADANLRLPERIVSTFLSWLIITHLEQVGIFSKRKVPRPSIPGPVPRV
jgi:hypothetical protein